MADPDTYLNIHTDRAARLAVQSAIISVDKIIN